MTLHDAIQDDALTVFCNADDFAEAVTYHPRQGGSRVINAVVVREAAGVFVDDVQTVMQVYQVHVANNPSSGIDSYELNLGGDAITFPPRDNKQPEKKTIVQLLTQDEGMLVLECR